MAIKLYEKDINKNINWGGDETTNGLPVSGEKIQKFIKESLNSKFGFMYYDKDPEGRESSTGVNVVNHTPTNQYVIFADADDFALWAANPAEGNQYVLARFDAPAPATIEITDNSSDLNTILLSDRDNQNLSFTCVVRDKSNNVVTDSCSVSISISNSVSGNVVLPTYNPTEQGKSFTFDFNALMSNKLGTYLLEGVNIVKCTITSALFNVSTTISFQYRVLNLSLISNFDDVLQPFNLYSNISLKNSTGFETTITANGTGQKFLRVFIDGKRINVLSEDKHVNELYLGANNPELVNVVIPFADINGDLYNWATEGKHNLQMYFYIKDNNNNEIKSQTLYYDFVLVDDNNVERSYILFKRVFENNSFGDINPEDPSILPANTNFTINSEQYLSFSTDYVVLDTFGRGSNADGSAVVVNIKLFDKTNLITPEFTLPQAIPSGSGSTFTYTAQNFGKKELRISSTVATIGGVADTAVINVNIKESDVKAKKATSGLELELTALNRSNTENEEDRIKWSYVKTTGLNPIPYEATFDNVLWNSQNGWIDNCLVLNNGATVTIPMNIFGQGGGVTFEIDFETSNVQDDDAVIMKYGSEDGSGIFINACNATLQSNKGINIHTNYKDGARQKIQFIFGYNQQADPETLSRFDCPYLMYMVVNGILDRVAQFASDDSYIGTSEAYNKFVIGNLDGKVTTKIHSIRVYTRPLTLDECVDNYIADSSEVRKNFLRNDIYNTDGKTINISKVLSADLHIPVMTIYGDITDSIVQVFDKKANVPVDILYQDPNFPEFNYFARDAWISNQGTSSMNYPRRNLRPYFNKAADAKTLRGHASNERYNYETRVWWGLTDTETIAKIQQGLINVDDPIVINGTTYTALRNKKTLKNKPQLIDYKTAVMFVHSGIKIYSDASCDKSVQIKKLNKYVEENPEGPIYVQGAYARYKHKDLYTDRWTLKCDYAESSMTHNAGVGRLWGDVMRDVEIGSEGFTYDIDGSEIPASKPGMTNAQRAVAEYNETHKDVNDGYGFGDIRTSCDGYPIIIINRPRIKEGNTFTEKYGDPIFLGLYNIMTDKGSTPLFGFEDLKDEDGNKIFDASKCECWECLQNGSNIAQMNDIVTDDTDGSTVPYTPGKANNEDRPIFASYEARWPDNDDLNDTCTNNLETVIRFVNFCKDAVTVTVDGKDGYTLSDFTAITEEEAKELWETGEYKNLANGTLYLGVPATSYKNKSESFYAKDEKGVTLYDEALKPVLIDKETAANKLLYKEGKAIIYYKQTYAAQNVTGMSFEQIFKEDDNDTVKINAIYAVLQGNKSPYVYTAEEDDSQIEQVPTDYYPNSGYTWYYYDKTYNRTNVSKVINTAELSDEVYTGRVFTYDGKRLTGENEQLHPDAWVTVYLKRNGNNYTYVNEMGDEVLYSSGEEIVTMTGNGHAGVIGKGNSFKGHTLFEYFQDQKYEHFDIWKLACYYIYVMRFAAVDQVIKNTMMTTEDGIHYYYINYDNDTVLGVRNDGYLVYDWQVDRNTYDSSIGGYAYAGFGSVLWNLLEQDQDFLDKVQTAARAMVSSNVLTYDIAVDMFNNKQSGTWSERLYNNSEMYKYIGIYNDIDNEGTNSYSPYQNTKYLPFLQGSRASHRDWWLRHRFDLFDAKWSAGEYEQAKIEVYMSATASPSNPAEICTITTGSKFYYTVLSNGRLLGNNFVELGNNVKHTFTTTSPLAIGDPLAILGGYNIKILDFSKQRDRLGSSLAINWDDTKFTSKMTQLILGGDTPTTLQPGCSLSNIINLGKLTALEVLDIRTAYNIKSVEISNLANLRRFLAEGSAITNFAPAKGAILDEVSLPNSITTLKLKEITLNDLTFKPGIALTKIEIDNINGSALKGNKLFDFILDWYITLKLANVRMTDYSCTLTFSGDERRIELEQYYGDKNGEVTTDITEWIDSIRTAGNIEHSGKKIKSLALLNAIKKDFGLDNTGSENFKISKGVIKLYGDNEETGGLTLENYNEMRSATFNNSTIKLWDDSIENSVFNSGSGFHFDSNSSVFVTISPYNENYKEPVNDNGEYTVIAGQKVLIKATIFPINNERRIDIIPSSVDPARGIEVNWSLNTNTGNRESNFGLSGGQRSTLFNDNGTATLEIYEYTDDAPKTMHITVTDSKILNAVGRPSEVAYVTINIENMVKPNPVNMIFTTIPDDGTPGVIVNRTSTQQIDEVKNYKYELSFNLDNINVDINSVHGSFNSNTIVEESEFGTLSVEFDDLLGKYVMNYVPNIQQNNTNVAIYMFVELNDRDNTVISNLFNVQLNTKAIETISLSYNGEEMPIEEDGSIQIEHYVKNESDIQSLNNQRVVKYRYKININPNSYNIPIKSMNVVVPDELITRYNIVTNMSETKENVIDSIDIVLPVSRESLYQIGEFNIVITDKYDTVISRKVNVKLGYFLPNGIDVVKIITNNGDFIYLNDTNNTDYTSILMGELPKFTFRFYTYSLVGGIKYVWGDSISITNHYKSESNIRFIPAANCPNATYGGLTNDDVFPYTDASDKETNLKSYFVNKSYSKSDGEVYKEITFNLSSDTATHLFETSGKLIYSVTFNGVTGKFNGKADYYIVSIQRIPAIAKSFDIYNVNVKAYDVSGDGITTSSNAAECMYILDRNLNLYNENGFNREKDELTLTNEGIKNYFIALIFVYINGNGNRKYTSLDPWKLIPNNDNNNNIYYWWNSSSIFARNNTGRQFANQTGYHYLLHGNTKPLTFETYQSYTEGLLYKTWYDYYRINCYTYNRGSSNPDDGGVFMLQFNNTGLNVDSSLEDICMEFYNGNITFNKANPTDNKITDKNMIFYYINDYETKGIPNVVCMPLSAEDYKNVMIHYETFKHYLDVLDSTSDLATLLFDINKYKAENGGTDEDFDNIMSYNVLNENTKKSKAFWYFDVPTENNSMSTDYQSKENIQITNKTAGDYPEVKIRINNGKIIENSGRINPQVYLYCLFGPRL